MFPRKTVRQDLYSITTGFDHGRAWTLGMIYFLVVIIGPLPWGEIMAGKILVRELTSMDGGAVDRDWAVLLTPTISRRLFLAAW